MLVQHIEQLIRVPEAVRLPAARLNRFSIPTCYPDAFDRGAPADQYFEPDARRAMEDAREIQRFAERAIGASS